MCVAGSPQSKAMGGFSVTPQGGQGPMSNIFAQILPQALANIGRGSVATSSPVAVQAKTPFYMRGR